MLFIHAIVFLCLLRTSRGKAEQHENHTIIIETNKDSVKLFAFSFNLPYDFNFSLQVIPSVRIDPSGEWLDQIIDMRFIYLYFVNSYGGIDFFPFVSRHLYLTGQGLWFKPNTEVRLAYIPNTTVTNFFRPGYLNSLPATQMKIITRLKVELSLSLRLSKRVRDYEG